MQRPTKRGGVRRYSELNPPNVPILNSEMDADLDPLYESQAWVTNYPKMTLAMDPAVATGGPKGIDGIEVGPPGVAKTRLYGYPTGAELAYNFFWDGSTSVTSEPGIDVLTEPSLTVDLSTGIGKSGSENTLCNFGISYRAPGELLTWWGPATFTMFHYPAAGVVDVASQLALQSMGSLISSRLIHYKNKDGRHDAEWSINTPSIAPIDDLTFASWSLDMSVHSSGGTFELDYRVPGSASTAWIPFLRVVPPNGDLTINGAVATKASGTTWANPSDPRLKDNVEPYPHGLAEILQLEPIRYTLNGLAGTPQGVQASGFDAEAVRHVFPESVTSSRRKLRPGDAEETDVLALDIHEILIALVNAVKELGNRVAALESK